ncbi:trigger factor [Hominisplanchenecus murintestinalis]|uniref:trigger factor n=1 Tax=Hominisplanchenecus murintestinalis TaxID=2941517 RepID=UPI00203E93F1|nr:trigger factor [Hominisplanchenecus murintestinalis]
MKRKVLLLATAICTVSLLAGCSEKDGSTESSATGANASTESYEEYVTLGEYKGLDVQLIKAEVTDDMVDDEIDMLLEDNAVYTPISDRGAAEGDTVNINYTGKIDGQEFDGGSAEDFELELGSGYLLDDLESQIVGMKSGETKDLNVSVPADYIEDTVEEDAPDKDAVFTVTVNSVSEKSLPEYSDEFIAGVTDYKTTAEYEEGTKKELLASLESDNRSTAGMDALSQVMENSTFNGYPQELYDSCKQEYDAMNEMYAEMLGVDVADLDTDEEETKSTIESIVNEKMVCAAIAAAENISVSDEEYQKYLEDNYALYDYASAAEYEETESKESLMNEILTEKIYNFLIDNAKITEISEDEYYGDDEDLDDEYLDEDIDLSDDLLLETEDLHAAETESETAE